MSPLKIEIIDPVTEAVRTLGELYPGDAPGSFSHFPPDGSRQIILFQCEADDSSSVIYKSEGRIDIEYGSLREEHSIGIEEIARISSGESFDLPIKTGNLKQEITVRFSHVERA
jgi:hypothetical protein